MLHSEKISSRYVLVVGVLILSFAAGARAQQVSTAPPCSTNAASANDMPPAESPQDNSRNNQGQAVSLQNGGVNVNGGALASSVMGHFHKKKQPAPTETASAPCAPAAAPTQTQAVSQSVPGAIASGKQWELSPGLFVPISEEYPAGKYKPDWRLTPNGQRVQFNVTDNVAGKHSMVTQKAMAIQIGDLNGRSVLVFNTGNHICAADIQNLPLTLGPNQQALRLGATYDTAPQGGPCSSGMNRYMMSWVARASLASQPSGDLTMNLEFRVLSDRGAVSYIYSAQNVAIQNAVTPAIARVQIAKDAEAAEAAKVAAEQAKVHDAELAVRDAQRARNGGVIDPDTTSPVNAMAGVKHLDVIMRNINDTGAFIVVHQDGSVEVASSAVFHFLSGGGAANDSLDSYLKPGRNVVVFLLHHKPFIIGGGGWSFQAALVGDGKAIWSGQQTDSSGPVGIQYWKAFTIVKKPSGLFSVSAANASLVQQLIPRMVKVNNSAIQSTSEDQQRQVSNILTSLMSSGHGQQSEDDPNGEKAAMRQEADDNAKRNYEENSQ